MATPKKVSKTATEKKVTPTVQTANLATLLKKIDLQLGDKKIKFSANDIKQANLCLKKTGRIKILFKDGTVPPPDGGGPGPID